MNQFEINIILGGLIVLIIFILFANRVASIMISFYKLTTYIILVLVLMAFIHNPDNATKDNSLFYLLIVFVPLFMFWGQKKE